jgi:hypothetical protein
MVLQSEPLKPEELELLNLGPGFCITPSTIPYLDITCPIEAGAKFLENQGQHDDANLLRQNACDILKKAKHPKSNLTSNQRQGLKSLQQKKGTSIAPYDKGKGFVVLDTETLKGKAFKEMENVSFDKKDGTKKLEKDICLTIDKLHADGKVSDLEKKELKPSDSIAPASWPAIKAHKPQKDFPARNVVSHIGCPQEQLSKLLIKLLQPLAKNDPFNCKNSMEIAGTFKEKTLQPDAKFVSYDATALFPNIPIEECINIIHEKLKKDTDLSNRTKMTPEDIKKLLELCLSTSYFIYDDKYHKAEDSGPIGLSLMVFISNEWMTHTIKSAYKIATKKNSTSLPS